MRQNDRPAIILGVTGGVGCGKSEALSYLERRYGARAIRADEVGKKLMRFGERCFDPVLHLFGKDILNPSGEFDRGKIAEKVFADRGLLDRLDAIIHPAVKEEITAEIEHAREKGGCLVCVESALLLEEHYDELCDEVWYIRADEDARRARLRLTRGYSDEKITAIMRNQLPEEIFRTRCDAVIDNSGDISGLREQIDARIPALCNGDPAAEDQPGTEPRNSGALPPDAENRQEAGS